MSHKKKIIAHGIVKNSARFKLSDNNAAASFYYSVPLLEIARASSTLPIATANTPQGSYQRVVAERSAVGAPFGKVRINELRIILFN